MPDVNIYHRKPEPEERKVYHNWEERSSRRRTKREKVTETRYSPVTRTNGLGVVQNIGSNSRKVHVGWDVTEYEETEWYCRDHGHYSTTTKVIRTYRTGK